MNPNFDIHKARAFLVRREALQIEERERERIAILNTVIDCLKNYFNQTDVEIYLVGSVTQPNKFHHHSDVDIVVKNFKGDRFDLWTELERLVNHRIEVIIFENCHFQDHILKSGYKVI